MLLQELLHLMQVKQAKLEQLELVVLVHYQLLLQVKLLQELLKQTSIDVNVQNDRGSTALHNAVSHIEVVRELLKMPGIDTNIKNNLGITAKKRALSKGHDDVAVLL